MRLRARIRDCLYLNWAVPAALLPPAPHPLRYERHPHGDDDYLLVSALLFRHHGLRLAALPLVKLSFPQFNLRLYVVDEQGMPSVLFVTVLVPAWVAPVVRTFTRQPARSASFSFHGRTPNDADDWRWQVSRRSRFACTARPGARATPDSIFSSWQATVDSVRLRNRGYFQRHGQLRRIDTENHPIEAIPVRAEVEEDALVAEALGIEATPPLHSAWLCPEMPLVFDFVPSSPLPMARGAPAPG